MLLMDELDQVLMENVEKRTSGRIRKWMGNNYCILGVDPQFINLLTPIVGNTLLLLDFDSRLRLIKNLLSSQMFEKVWLGYKILSESKELLIKLQPSDILDIKPIYSGFFFHLYTFRILLIYVRHNKTKDDLIIKLINGQKLDEQLMAAQILLVLSKNSDYYKNLSQKVLNLGVWKKDNKLDEMIQRLKRGGGKC